MWAKAHFLKKTKGSVSFWMKHSREDYTFFFLFNRENSNHCPTFLPFPHSTLQISKCFHHLCLICLFPFQAISWMLFLNPLLLKDESLQLALLVLQHPTRLLPLALPEVLRRRKCMHTLFKDTQISMYEDKGSQGKSRMQAIPGQGKGLKSYSSVRFHLGTPKTCIRI